MQGWPLIFSLRGSGGCVSKKEEESKVKLESGIEEERYTIRVRQTLEELSPEFPETSAGSWKLTRFPHLPGGDETSRAEGYNHWPLTFTLPRSKRQMTNKEESDVKEKIDDKDIKEHPDVKDEPVIIKKEEMD